MNRKERRERRNDPSTRGFLDGYESALAAVPAELRDKAWATMVYGCSDQPKPARPVPPDWDRIVANAPAGYWEARGGVPETIEVEGRRVFPGAAAGCGHEELYYLCVGVEKPRSPIVGYPAAYVPSPFVCGRCPKCGQPLSHIQWARDREWWPPTELPEGAAHFRLPDLAEARKFAAEGYGGGLFVPASARDDA